MEIGINEIMICGTILTFISLEIYGFKTRKWCFGIIDDVENFFDFLSVNVINGLISFAAGMILVQLVPNIKIAIAIIIIVGMLLTIKWGLWKIYERRED